MNFGPMFWKKNLSHFQINYYNKDYFSPFFWLQNDGPRMTVNGDYNDSFQGLGIKQQQGHTIRTICVIKSEITENMRDLLIKAGVK
jgi:hypothetical protein